MNLAYRHIYRHMAALTMLELTIVLAIVAVVAAYALPSYQRFIARGYRVDAVSALYRAVLFIEGQGGGDELPSGFDQAPQHGNAVYGVRRLPADEDNGGYAVQARPLATGPMQNDICGTFILDATGARSNLTAQPLDKAQMSDCWHER